MAQLGSWKEIANYLSVSIRTAQTWERDRGLPVRRIPGPRGRVFAETAELDAWKMAQGSSVAVVAQDPVGGSGRRWVAGGLAAVAVVAIGLGWWNSRRGEPAAWRYRDATLTVEDAAGREVWRKSFADPGEEWGDLYGPRGWVGDLDGDGRNEVLFVQTPRSDSHVLVAFGAGGKELWRFVVGKTVVTKKNTYAAPYIVQQFRVIGDGKIVVTSCHKIYHPNQTVVLDGKGKVLHEWWHSGRLGALAVVDLNGDGEKELYLGGVSQGYKQATVVRLNWKGFGGASAEEDEMYQIQGLAAGYGVERALLPRSCVNRELEKYNGVCMLQGGGGRLTVDVVERPSQYPVAASVQFMLDHELRVAHYSLSDTFEAQHRLLRAQGIHRHELEGDAGRMREIRVLER